MHTPMPTEEQLQSISKHGIVPLKHVFYREIPPRYKFQGYDTVLVEDKTGVLVHAVLRLELKLRLHEKAVMTIWNRKTNFIHEGVVVISANSLGNEYVYNFQQYCDEVRVPSANVDDIAFIWLHWRVSKPYDELNRRPVEMAYVLTEMEFKGDEWSLAKMEPAEIADLEMRRKLLTTDQRSQFATFCDNLCRMAYSDRIDWFVEVVDTVENKGWDKLEGYMRHWLAGYLRNPNTKLKVPKKK